MLFLRDMTIDACPGAYPFNSPAVTALSDMPFSSPVTLLVGENGSGKSTLLEALARKLALPAIGAQDASRDVTLAGVDALADSMRLKFSIKPTRGFFLRAEDFFGYTRRIAAMQAEMREELARVRVEYAGKSAFTRGQAIAAYAGSLGALNETHGENPDARSHGESFMHLFSSRVHPGGLYLLDEPEAPLSPIRQLSLIALMLERESDSQFIIATHSPMLMAYPGAAIWSFDEAPAAQKRYNELESVALIRDFLQAPGRYIARLQNG